jgi:hypothetical protein
MSVKDTYLDFAQPISIPFDTVSNFMPATPEKVEKKWNAMKCSGQGDGGYTEDDNANNTDKENNGGQGDVESDADDHINNFDSLNGCPQRVLDLHPNFFDDRSTYLLYLWDILDEHDLVQ